MVFAHLVIIFISFILKHFITSTLFYFILLCQVIIEFLHSDPLLKPKICAFQRVRDGLVTDLEAVAIRWAFGSRAFGSRSGTKRATGLLVGIRSASSPLAMCPRRS